MKSKLSALVASAILALSFNMSEAIAMPVNLCEEGEIASVYAETQNFFFSLCSSPTGLMYRGEGKDGSRLNARAIGQHGYVSVGLGDAELRIYLDVDKANNIYGTMYILDRFRVVQTEQIIEARSYYP